MCTRAQTHKQQHTHTHIDIFTYLQIHIQIHTYRIFAGVREGVVLSDHTGFSHFENFSTCMMWLFRMSVGADIDQLVMDLEVSVCMHVCMYLCMFAC
jgi:hypothetical protein